MKPSFRLRNHVLMMSLAAAYPVVGYTANAATVEFAAGSVVAITPSGSQRVLAKGGELLSGETIRTGDGGRAQLKFSDGGLMSLQPQTEFRIDNYQYAGKSDGQEKGFFSLIKGGLRTISGLVGKVNRDNYKISTQVATIGIRGTEYSVAFTGGNDGKLSLATGEGAVEVCNAGGCVIVSGGEAAVVTGANSQPKRTESRPALPPSSATSTPVTQTTTTSKNDDRTSDGSIATVVSLAELKSGDGYNVAYAGLKPGNSSFFGQEGPLSLTFNSGSKLATVTTSQHGTFVAGQIDGAISVDGQIGWGRWSSGTVDNGGYSGAEALSSFHFVAGKGTSASDLAALGGLQGTYTLLGGTNPTSSTGAVGTLNSAALTVNFSASTVSLDMSVSMGANTYVARGVTGSTGSGTFSVESGSMSGGTSGTSIDMAGFFAGANAKYAGAGYKITDLGQTITGAMALKQTGLTAAPQAQ